jgi:hypothetical protein
MFHDMRSVQSEMALLTSSRASQTHGHPEGRAARLFTLILEGPRLFTTNLRGNRAVWRGPKDLGAGTADTSIRFLPSPGTMSTKPSEI